MYRFRIFWAFIFIVGVIGTIGKAIDERTLAGGEILIGIVFAVWAFFLIKGYGKAKTRSMERRAMKQVEQSERRAKQRAVANKVTNKAVSIVGQTIKELWSQDTTARM